MLHKENSCVCIPSRSVLETSFGPIPTQSRSLHPFQGSGASQRRWPSLRWKRPANGARHLKRASATGKPWICSLAFCCRLLLPDLRDTKDNPPTVPELWTNFSLLSFSLALSECLPVATEAVRVVGAAFHGNALTGFKESRVRQLSERTPPAPREDLPRRLRALPTMGFKHFAHFGRSPMARGCSELAGLGARCRVSLSARCL